jgi:hypothetical protein
VNVGLKPRPASWNREVLAGLIERVTFHNAANGFCDLRVIKPRSSAIATSMTQVLMDRFQTFSVFSPRRTGGIGCGDI